jgi:Helicase conserved C-terminal domain
MRTDHSRVLNFIGLCISMYDVVPGTLQRLREADIVGMAGLTLASLGLEYCRIGAVHATKRQGARLSGIVEVSNSHFNQGASTTNGAKETGQAPLTPLELYSVEVEMRDHISCNVNCTCSQSAAQSPVVCAHAAALLYAWLAHPLTFKPPTTSISSSTSQPFEQQAAKPLLAAEQTGNTTLEMNQPRPLPQARPVPTLQPLVPASNTAEMLAQSGLNELRGIARECDITTNGLSKQQLAEAIVELLKQPEAVRRVVATLEKQQRQLLAALTLAGGSMNDEDLRGLSERFSLGGPGQLQSMLLILQSKALIVRAALNSSMQQRIGMSGSPYDISWHVPAEVRAALHVTLPVTPFDVKAGSGQDADSPKVQQVEPYSLLADLLLVARALDGNQLEHEERYYLSDRLSEARTQSVAGRNKSEDYLSDRLSEARTQSVAGRNKSEDYPSDRLSEARTQSVAGRNKSEDYQGSARPRPLSPLPVDGSIAILAPDGMPSNALLKSLQSVVPRPLSFLRFAICLLKLAGIIFVDDGGTSSLRVLPNAAELLLGPTHIEVAHELYTHWLNQPAYEELFELQEQGLRLCCRTTPLNLPALRPGELEAENREARQTLIALLAQAPAGQWINFTALARFVYRLNPIFLQKRQRQFPAPHWWIEHEGRPLRPTQLNDWMRAEGRYLTNLLQGPLHWWGISDVALAADGRLLAFRLTPLADSFLHEVGAQFIAPGVAPGVAPATSPAIDVSENGDLLIPCTFANWPLIELIERYAEAQGIHAGQLCYRLTPGSLSEAFSRGESPAALLDLLHRAAEYRQALAPDSPLVSLLAQLERRIASYGRVRLYTEVSLLEAADQPVLRELNATTSLQQQIVRPIHPTLLLLKKQAVERLIDELKRRGQVPLLHESGFVAPRPEE